MMVVTHRSDTKGYPWCHQHDSTITHQKSTLDVIKLTHHMMPKVPLYRVIHKKSNPTGLYYNNKIRKILKCRYSPENAIMFFHTLKTTAYARNGRHQPEDRPMHTALYSLNCVTTQGDYKHRWARSKCNPQQMTSLKSTYQLF